MSRLSPFIHVSRKVGKYFTNYTLLLECYMITTGIYPFEKKCHKSKKINRRILLFVNQGLSHRNKSTKLVKL